ncbi:hypothetical protein ACHAO5_009019, partial [Verticillium nonalfalfae]
MGWFDRKKVVKANKTAEPQIQYQTQLQPQTQHHQVPALPAPPSYHNAVTNQPSQQWAPPFGFQPGFGPAPVVVNQVQNFYGLADNNNSEARPPTAQTQLVARPKHRHDQPLDTPQSKPTPKSSCAALTVPDMAEIEAGFHPHAQELIHQTSLAVDLLTNTFAAVLATIDEPTAPEKESPHSKPGARKTRPSKSSTKPAEKPPSSSSPLAKIYAYANSRLPSDLKPLRLYIPTWPLLCLAAHYAEIILRRPD